MVPSNLKIIPSLSMQLVGIAKEHWPQEIAGLVAGYCLDGWACATKIVKIRIFKSTKRSVMTDLNEIKSISDRVFILASYHSHPNGFVTASPQDLVYMENLDKLLKRNLYYLIVSKNSIGAYYQGRQVKYTIK